MRDEIQFRVTTLFPPFVFTSGGTHVPSYVSLLRRIPAMLTGDLSLTGKIPFNTLL